MRSSGLAAGFVLAYLAALGVYGVLCNQPPTPLPADAPPDRFSAQRALRHVRAAFVEPHPVGTAAHRRVSEYLLRTLREMGVEPQVQETTSIRALPGRAPARGANVAMVRNILLRLPGRSPTRALLLMAHYDSVIWGPGAADDGSGCAVLLETLRAVLAGPPLANDVIFLFADAEESGLMGAYAFAREHPWMRDVGLVLNFDVRGVAGPSFMYETGKNNAWLMRHFGRACSRPLANSLMPALYYRMGLNSDFSVFRDLGLPGLNFAFIRGIAYYHTANDNPDRLNPASLQHQGNNALELVRYFGNIALKPEAPQGDAIYFNPVRFWLISYPAGWVAPFAAATLLWLSMISVVGVTRRRISWRGLRSGACLFLGMAGAGVAGTGLVTLLAWKWRRYYMVYDNAFWLALAVAVTLGVFSALLNRSLRRVHWEEAYLGAIWVWAALLILSALVLPQASFGFQWPLGFALVAITGEFLLGHSTLFRPKALLWHALCAAPILLLGVPAACALHDGFTGVLAPITAAWVGLLLGLLIPLLVVVREWVPGALPAGSAVAAVAVAIAVALRAAGDPTPARPYTVSLSYALNADTGEAFWVSRSQDLNLVERRFLTAHPARGSIREFRPGDSGIYVKQPAPAVRLEPVRCEVVSDGVTGQTRRLRVRLSSPRGSSRLAIHMNPETEILRSAINGKPYATGRPWWFEFHGLGDRAAELMLEMRATARPELTLVEYTPGLPDVPGSGPAWLPPGYILEPNTTGWGKGLRSGWTLVRRTCRP